MKHVLEPAPGKIVVKPDPPMSSSVGLVIVTDRRGTVGEVVAVYEPFIKPEEAAEGTETTAFYVVGDRVIFGPHSGVEVTIDREKFVVLREMEILTKIIEQEEPATVAAGGSEHDDLED